MIVLLGPPGAGKSTVGRFLEKYGFRFVSAGDLVRDEIKKGSELGKQFEQYAKEGKYIPDELIVPFILSKVDEHTVLDGFPRTLKQAEAIQGKVQLVIFLDVSEDECVKRLSGRRICPRCGRVYNVYTMPPKNDELCDICGVKLVQREDDREEVVRRRFREYKEKTTPLIEYYAEQGILARVDANVPPEGECKRVLEVLKAKGLIKGPGGGI